MKKLFLLLAFSSSLFIFGQTKKTYYKGNRKLTVWVENGKEYQYPPKK